MLAQAALANISQAFPFLLLRCSAFIMYEKGAKVNATCCVQKALRILLMCSAIFDKRIGRISSDPYSKRIFHANFSRGKTMMRAPWPFEKQYAVVCSPRLG